MFIEVTAKGCETNKKWTININSIAFIRSNPDGDGTRIHFNSNDSLRYIDVIESYEVVKKGLECCMRQMSKRIILCG